MDPDYAFAFEVSRIAHTHLDEDYMQLSHWSRNDFTADHAYRGWISGGVEMAVEAIRRSGSHWKCADEIHEAQLVQWRAARALAGFSFRRFPRFLIGIEVNRLVVVGQGIPLVLEKTE